MATGTAVTLTVNAISNPLGSGTTAPFVLSLTDPSDTLLTTGSSAKGVVKITAGALTWGTASAPDLRSLNVTDYDFNFKLRNKLAADAQIVVYLPGYLAKTPTLAPDGNGFEAYGSTTFQSGSLDGGWTVAMSGAFNRAITITRDGTGNETPAGTNVTFTLTDIKNGVKAGAFGFEVRTADGKVTDALLKGPKVTPTASPDAFAKFEAKSHALGKWDPKKSRLSTVNLTWAGPKGMVVDGFSYGYDGSVDTVADTNGTTLAAQITNVPDGLHVFEIRAFNATTGWTGINQLGLIGIDTTVPTAPVITSLTHPADACGSSRVPTFTWSGSDATSGLNAKAPYTYTLDGASKAIAATTFSVTKALAPGAHTFTVTAKDNVLWTNASATYAFDVCN